MFGKAKDGRKTSEITSDRKERFFNGLIPKKQKLTVPKGLNAKERKQVKKILKDANPDTSRPETAQQSIPFEEMMKDGICRVKGNYYTKPTGSASTEDPSIAPSSDEPAGEGKLMYVKVGSSFLKTIFLGYL